MNPFLVAALYKFVTVDDTLDLQQKLKQACTELNIRGTLLVAPEGINGTVSGQADSIKSLIYYLKQDPRFSDIDCKYSWSDENPFFRMKVKLKKEIVTLGVEGIDPNQCVGRYVDPKDWNRLLLDPEVLVIDTRNDYEVEIGRFKNALNPQTQTFREFPDYVQSQLDPAKTKKVAMYCTGGIRCEKSTAFMLQQGFEEVYHLKGGILKYLEEIPSSDSLWEGECFVFDQRVAVKHGLEQGDHELCHACRHPITEKDKHQQSYVEGVSCPHCVQLTSEEDKTRFAQRQEQIERSKANDQAHLGATPADIEASRARKKARKLTADLQSRQSGQE